MNFDFSVCVILLFCFGEAHAWRKNSAIHEQERFSKVRYLKAQAENDVETSRPLFYWESAPITTSSTENSQFMVTFPVSEASKLLAHSNNEDTHSRPIDKRRKRKRKQRKTKIKPTILDASNLTESATNKNLKPSNSTEKILRDNKRRHRKKHKQKRKQRRRRRKNKKDNDNNVLEIPKKAKNITNISSWNLKNDSSIQDVILKLNKNPESSYENLLGKGVAEDEVKISNPKSPNGRINVSSPSLPNLNVFGISSNDYKNDTRILLDTRESSKTRALKKSSNKNHFYDSTILGTTASTITESIFKNAFKKSEDKISNKNETFTESTRRRNYNVPKINYSELMKPTKGKQANNSTNIHLVNYRNELDGVNNNLDVLQTNQIAGYFGKSFNSSDFKTESKYRGFKCNINNGGCAHICSEYNIQKCSCLEGFTLGRNERSCLDIDECSQNNGGCESLCYNILGSYYCGCSPGLRIGDDLKSCEDINECLLRNGHGPCQDICTNTFGSYFCGCSDLNGTRLADDKHFCEDVNECKEGRSGCSHGCINTHGRAFCTCPDGMDLGSDWKTCYDINECEDETVQKQCKYGCLNTLGSYHCLDLQNEQNDQIPAAPENISCPPMFPPKHGFFHCSRKKVALGGFKTKDGRMRVTNRPGTLCELVCPVGFKNVGDFRVFCGYDGRWTGQQKGKCSLLLGRNFDIHYNYIEVIWAFPKPKIKCRGPLSIQLKPGEEIAHVTFPPPKANVDWRYVESEPASAKNLEIYLPQGHHWITFKATNPSTQLSAKCIVYVVIRKTKIYHPIL